MGTICGGNLIIPYPLSSPSPPWMEYLKGQIDIIVDYGKMPFVSELILANFERIINMILVVLFHVFSEFTITQSSFFIMMNSENTWKIYSQH